MIIIKTEYLHFKTKILTDILFYCAAGFIYAIGVTSFNSPNHIAPGGVTGISTVINYVTGIPIGTLVFIINIPILAFAYKQSGRRLLFKSVTGTVITSVFIDLLDYLNFPIYKGDVILAAIFGGVLTGAGLSLIFLRGGTTGGTDVLAIMITKRLKNLSIGQIILAIDCLIIAAAALVYRNIESALYSGISLFVTTKIIDAVLYGLDRGKLIFIITEKQKLISDAISQSLKRGTTIINAYGSYTGKSNCIVMCAIRRNETANAREVIQKCDPNAFVIIGDAHEIIGLGFQSEAQIKEYM